MILKTYTLHPIPGIKKVKSKRSAHFVLSCTDILRSDNDDKLSSLSKYSERRSVAISRSP